MTTHIFDLSGDNGSTIPNLGDGDDGSWNNYDSGTDQVSLPILSRRYEMKDGPDALFLEDANHPLGPELVVNGGFDTDSGWTKGTGWTISVGVASSDGSQVSNSLLYQDAGTVSGKRYLVTFTVSSFTSGKITAYSGDSGAGTARSATGAYSQVITCSGANANRINLVASSSFVGSIDNISVRCIETGAVLYNTDSSDWDRSKT